MTVLQLCVSMGVQACAKGMPILAEELNEIANQFDLLPLRNASAPS